MEWEEEWYEEEWEGEWEEEEPVMGLWPECTDCGPECPYWGGDGICMIAIEEMSKLYDEYKRWIRNAMKYTFFTLLLLGVAYGVLQAWEHMEKRWK